MCVLQLPCPFITMLSVYYVSARLEVSHLFGFDHHGVTHPFVLHLRCTPSRAFDVETRRCVRVKVAMSVCVCVIMSVVTKALAWIESEVRKDSTERKREKKQGRMKERRN